MEKDVDQIIHFEHLIRLIGINFK